MTILVTGSSGLLGRSAIKLLAETDETIVAVDRATPKSQLGNIRFEQADVTDFRQLADLCVRHSVTRVLHLAALVHHLTHQMPLDALKVNVMGFGNILEAARIFGLDRVVYASSVVVYGNSGAYAGAVTERDLHRPGTLYGATKTMNEGSAAHYASAYGIRAIGLRPHFSFGPGRYDGSAGQFNAFVKACATGRQSTWNRVFRPGTMLAPIYAEDMARAFVHALVGPALPSLVYNVGGSSQLTEEEMVQTVGRLTGNLDLTPVSAGAEYNLDLPPIDCGLFLEESGFKHRHSFVSAVEACIAHYRETAGSV